MQWSSLFHCTRYILFFYIVTAFPRVTSDISLRKKTNIYFKTEVFNLKTVSDFTIKHVFRTDFPEIVHQRDIASSLFPLCIQKPIT